jgi:hypothetical protein
MPDRVLPRPKWPEPEPEPEPETAAEKKARWDKMAKSEIEEWKQEAREANSSGSSTGPRPGKPREVSTELGTTRREISALRAELAEDYGSPSRRLMAHAAPAPEPRSTASRPGTLSDAFVANLVTPGTREFAARESQRTRAQRQAEEAADAAGSAVGRDLRHRLLLLRQQRQSEEAAAVAAGSAVGRDLQDRLLRDEESTSISPPPIGTRGPGPQQPRWIKITHPQGADCFPGENADGSGEWGDARFLKKVRRDCLLRGHGGFVNCQQAPRDYWMQTQTPQQCLEWLSALPNPNKGQGHWKCTVYIAPGLVLTDDNRKFIERKKEEGFQFSYEEPTAQSKKTKTKGKKPKRKKNPKGKTVKAKAKELIRTRRRRRKKKSD